MEFSQDQLKALEILNSGKNCFIHGDAGTGKSTLIEHFSLSQAQAGKAVGKCAFTGLATMNLLKRNDNETVATINTLFEFKTPFAPIKKKTVKHISGYDIIIVDEISTCTALYFSVVSETIKRANVLRKQNNLPEIQLIVCGDFYQLSPFYDYQKWAKDEYGQWYQIEDNKMKLAIGQIVGFNENNNPNLYAFACKYWKEWNFEYVLLSQNHRQEHDIEYMNNLKLMRESSDLNQLRNVCQYFNTNCYRPIPQNINIINLYWRNDVVEQKNNEELQKLEGQMFHYHAEKTGELQFIDSVKFLTLPIVEDLYIKKGAQVIFTTNDIKNKEREYANGDLAVVEDCDQDSLKLRLLRNNRIIYLNFYTCSTTLTKPPRYKAKPDGKVEIIQEKYDGEIFQFPIKLAYALTIYKAQGQTFENVNVLYSGQAEHVLYVALSRARTIQNLFLSKQIWPNQIKHSKVVEEFYKNKGIYNLHNPDHKIDNELLKKLILEIPLPVKEPKPIQTDDESSFPDFLKQSIKNVLDSSNLEWLGDCYYDELISSINVAETENLISKEQANNLRKKYLK